MKKQQQWWLLFKLFSSKTTLTPPPPPLINFSSSTSSPYIARPFCSLATTTTTNTSLLAAVKKNLPLLIVPYDVDGVGNDTIGFTCLFDDDDVDLQKKKKKKKKAVHKMYLPEIADRRICGSSKGWLITIHENTEVQLLNPFSKVLVNLPPLLTSFPEVVVGKVEKENYRGGGGGGGGGLCYLVHEHMRGVFEEKDSTSNSESLKGYDSHYFRDNFFKKVATSTDATVVMAIYGEYTKLAFCRPSGNDGDEQNKWMVCLHGDRIYFDDVTFYKGNFYAVGCFGDVVVVKGFDHGPSVVPFVETIIDRGEKTYSSKNYLVESSSSSSLGGAGSGAGDGGGGGDLLKVMRDVVYYRTTRFRVFKVDFNNGRRARWVEVTNLGEDCALFIGYNHSFSFSASKIPGCRGNCIYFTDENLEPFDENNPYGEHDMGVYNLEDGSIEKLNYETSPYLIRPPPIWYVPN